MAAKNPQYFNNKNNSYTPDESQVSRPKRRLLAQAVSATLLAGVSSGPVWAEQAVLEEVIVTATKRAESVMEVPLAITAMSGEFLRDVNLDDVKDLIAFTPGITGNTKDSFMDFVSVRGIRTIDYGNGGDPSISIFKNGLYQGRTGSGVVSLYDLDRAEILRGPQGFMFGRNSVSGAMNIITAKPSVEETEGYLDLDLGENGHAVVEGAINLPVNDNFAVRLSGYHSEEDGYVKNLQGGPDLIGHDKTAFRLSGRYEKDKLRADFFVEHEDRDQDGTVYRATGEGDSFNVVQTRINGGVPYEVPRDGQTVNVDNSLGSTDGGKIFSVGLQIDYDMGWGTFTSITGYKDHEYDYIEDYDATPTILFNYGQDQEGDYFEQEFRITSSSDSPLSWYAGASYYKEDIDTMFLGQQAEDAYCLAYWSNTCQDMFDYYNYLDTYYGNTYFADYYLTPYFGTTTWTSSPDGLINDRNHVKGKYTGYSAYVDLSYEFSESFDVSFGLRYNYDEKDFSQQSLPDPGNSVLAYKVQTGFQTLEGPLTDTQDWNETTYRIVANWYPNDTTLLFASVTSGYKPGGFGSFNIEGNDGTAIWGREIAVPGVARPGDFGPETVTSFDIGYKGTIAGGRSQIAVNAFFYDYEDMQAIFGVTPVIVDNIGQIDGMGVEIDTNTALTDNITLRLGMSWFDSEANNVQAFCGEGELITGDPDTCEGNSIPWAPEWTAFAILNANFPTGNGAEIFANVAWTWEDDTRVGWPAPSVIFQNLEGINQTDIVVGYRADKWQVSAYVENVFDELWYDAAYETGDPDSPYVEHTFGPARPRTIGMRFGYEL
jgi:iron complex outermembrane receptor protein